MLLFPLALVGIWNATPTAAAQEIGISGFIKTSYYYDTNQIPAVREGDFVLYPIFVDDGTGENDESAEQDNLLFVPFFSRLTFSVGDLPEALGAKTTGYLEGDFYGPGNATNNTYRIRRAFVKLDWATHEVLFGMDWTPLFLSSWARTVATEAGAPFNPFARHVMAKLVLKPESFRLTGILSQQRDAFAEIGGLKQQQQSGLPGAMLGLEYVGEGGTNVGLNAYYKWIRPGLTTDRFGSGAVQAYANLITEGLEARGNVTFGGDLADHLLTGGYAVLTDGTNVEFVPLNTVAAWLDLQTRGDLSVGIFGGYSQSLGTAEDDARGRLVEFVARGYGDTPIQNVWRVSPRVTYTSGKVRIGAEVQATGAAYVVGGDIYDESLAPDGDTENVVNIRGNLSVFLFF
ncbi:MAG: hypothetical protein AAGF99_06220 [Bacteroidota bacterium]